MNKAPVAADYANLLRDIKDRIRSAQYEALRAVNKELIGLYWDIGSMIVERQKGRSWGKAVVERLAKDLQVEFPGIKGLSPSSLWRMKLFYKSYKEDQKLAPLVREIGWTHNIVIMEKCKDILQREFYIRMTRKFGWTKNVLIHQIENQTYEKTLLSQNMSARCSFTWLSWMTIFGLKTRILPSGSSFARVRTRSLLNIHCGTRTNPLEWLHTKS